MDKTIKNRMKISIAMNMIIVVLTVISSIIMYTGFKFMHGPDVILESTKIGMFRFFTVDSNVFAGLVSAIFVVKEIQILREKCEGISSKLYKLKLMSTTAVGLTFFVVFVYLGPIAKDGLPSMLMNSNLFFHLIIPVLSIINFVVFERSNKLTFKHSFYGLIPTALYAIYYLTNIFIHMENGKVSPLYDWYWFVQYGVWTSMIVVPIIMVITYLISLVLWKSNKISN